MQRKASHQLWISKAPLHVLIMRTLHWPPRHLASRGTSRLPSEKFKSATVTLGSGSWNLLTLPHFLNIFSPTSLSTFGLKTMRSFWLISFNSSNSFHTSTANPAAMAAPRAVVSRMAGRSTGMPMIFACVYRKQLVEAAYTGICREDHVPACKGLSCSCRHRLQAC